MTKRTLEKHFGKPNFFVKRSNTTHLPVEVGYMFRTRSELVSCMNYLEATDTLWRWSLQNGFYYVWVEVTR